MPEGRCKNKECNRLIFDTEKLDELQDKIECQHCHHVNIIRQAGEWCFGGKKKKKSKTAPKPVEPAPSMEEITPETEQVPETAPEIEQVPETEPSEEELIPGPALDESGY